MVVAVGAHHQVEVGHRIVVVRAPAAEAHVKVQRIAAGAPLGDGQHFDGDVQTEALAQLLLHNLAEQFVLRALGGHQAQADFGSILVAQLFKRLGEIFLRAVQIGGRRVQRVAAVGRNHGLAESLGVHAADAVGQARRRLVVVLIHGADDLLAIQRRADGLAQVQVCHIAARISDVAPVPVAVTAHVVARLIAFGFQHGALLAGQVKHVQLAADEGVKLRVGVGVLHPLDARKVDLVRIPVILVLRAADAVLQHPLAHVERAVVADVFRRSAEQIGADFGIERLIHRSHDLELHILEEVRQVVLQLANERVIVRRLEAHVLDLHFRSAFHAGSVIVVRLAVLKDGRERVILGGVDRVQQLTPSEHEVVGGHVADDLALGVDPLHARTDVERPGHAVLGGFPALGRSRNDGVVFRAELNQAVPDVAADGKLGGVGLEERVHLAHRGAFRADPALFARAGIISQPGVRVRFRRGHSADGQEHGQRKQPRKKTFFHRNFLPYYPWQKRVLAAPALSCYNRIIARAF